MNYQLIKFLPILPLVFTIALGSIAPVVAEQTHDLPTVSTAIEIDRANGRSVKLVGTYVGTASILSRQKSSSGRTFIVLEAKIVTSDNTQVKIYADAPMLGQLTRSQSEIERYHERMVVVTGKIAKEKNQFSIIPEKIDTSDPRP